MRPFLCLFFLFPMLRAQQTLRVDPTIPSPKAGLEQVAWLQGHWIGEAFGGTAEEIWTAPMGDSMMFAFRLVVDGKVDFYEIGHIRQVNGSLVLQLKHFGGDLKGWEAQDETVDFPLVRLEPDGVYFDGLTYIKTADGINAHVLIRHDDGTYEEIGFTFKRQ